MMAYNSSTTSLNFSSSTSESSLYSSPCSSPSSLPQSPPQYVCKVSVPFLWEEKPGITKPSPCPSPSPSSLKACPTPTHIFYGNSLEFPPLPPPPCLSQAYLSHPKSRASKLIAAHSPISKRPHEAKPSKEDPFFLALKACTKVDSKCSGDVSKSGFEAALSIFKHSTKKGQKSMECKRGDSNKNYEHSDHHQTRREASFNLHQTRREMAFNGEGNRRGKSLASSTHGALYSIDERASRVETTRSNLHSLMLEKDEESTNLMAKRAHHHMNAAGKASSNGFLIDVGVANKATKDDPLQGLHSKASRREHLDINDSYDMHRMSTPIGMANSANPFEIGAKVRGHRKPNVNGRELIANGHRKPKHNNDGKAYNNGREINNALYRMNEGHSKAKHSAKVVEFNHCGGYLRYSDNDVNKHHASKPNMLTDMLGCKALNGAAIHPSLHFHKKLFSAHH